MIDRLINRSPAVEQFRANVDAVRAANRLQNRVKMDEQESKARFVLGAFQQPQRNEPCVAVSSERALEK